MFAKYLIIVSILFLLISCDQKKPPLVEFKKYSESAQVKEYRNTDIHSFEILLQEQGLLDVQDLDSNIRVHLRYGTTDNFMGIDFYDGFNKCYLQKEVAEKLVNAQKFLKKLNPKLNLLVWDAARPQSVQKMMWDSVIPPPGVFKGYLVSNPNPGSIHNYGCAVDVTLIDEDGHILDMGTEFDHFGEEAFPVMEDSMLRQGKITKEHVRNRKLLRSIMYKAGFYNIQTEWWHFNACRREVAMKKYQIIK